MAQRTVLDDGREKQDDRKLLHEIHETVSKITCELAKRIVGQEAVIRDLLACVLAGGHCLIIGVPGLAKTLLVSCLAQCISLRFSRIQFTPDLMPADITGSEILFEDKTTGHREFRFIKGPIFSNIVLADEINRTPPKTQSALLQAMQEAEITSGGIEYPLPQPFWVLATQNPIEQEGTYPLPEAQQDRFMFALEISYPKRQEEIDIVQRTTIGSTDLVQPVITAQKLLEYRRLLVRIPVATSVVSHAVSLCRSTRPEDEQCPEEVKKLLTWGAGPRGSQFLVLAAKVYAAMDGRPTADIRDVEKAAYPVLRHRLVRSFYAEAEGIAANDIVDKLLKHLPG